MFFVYLKQLEKKLKQSEESMKKADRDYHDGCLKAEQARQEWETQVYKVPTPHRPSAYTTTLPNALLQLYMYTYSISYVNTWVFKPFPIRIYLITGYFSWCGELKCFISWNYYHRVFKFEGN